MKMKHINAPLIPRIRWLVYKANVALYPLAQTEVRLLQRDARMLDNVLRSPIVQLLVLTVSAVRFHKARQLVQMEDN